VPDKFLSRVNRILTKKLGSVFDERVNNHLVKYHKQLHSLSKELARTTFF